MNESKFQYNVNKNSIEYCDNHFAYCNGEEYKIVKKLNNLMRENEQLKSSNLEYEDALARFEEKNQQLKEEVDYWKKRTLNRENEYAIEDSVKWLRENTVWEQMPTNIRTFTKTAPLKKKELDMND